LESHKADNWGVGIREKRTWKVTIGWQIRKINNGSQTRGQTRGKIPSKIGLPEAMSGKTPGRTTKNSGDGPSIYGIFNNAPKSA